jgi:MOB kinase activator 1
MERQNTLGSSELWEQVKLPEGASVNEWLAVNTIDIFNDLTLLTGALRDCCTEATCPVMRAGQFVFSWCDGHLVKTPARVSAPTYYALLLNWVEGQLRNFPVDPGEPFPSNFRKCLRVIYKRLFRIYAHVYHSHFKEMVDGEADAHLNHSFKHFIYFVKEFKLIEDAELEPLKEAVALCMGQILRDKGFTPRSKKVVGDEPNLTPRKHRPAAGKVVEK